jgi:putative transposase
MARLPRLALAGEPHLMVQRAHGGHAVLVSEEDHRRYLDALRESAAHHGLLIHAYALLPERVWLLATPRSAESLSRTLQALGRRFGADYNRRHGRTGALWEGRFRSTVVDPAAYFLRALRHVEAAPVRAGASDQAGHFAWSSAGHHLGLRRDPLITEHAAYWAMGNTPFDRQGAYRDWLAEPEALEATRKIEDACIKGWPLAGAHFIAQLEGRAPRRVIPLTAGRPRKTVPNK